MAEQSSHRLNISVNLDVANLPMDAAQRALAAAHERGRVLVCNAYADFRRADLADLQVQLFQLGYRLIHCPSWPNGDRRLKSVVDAIMAQDLRDQLEERSDIDIFMVATGDRDFIPVVHALRRKGRRVIVISEPASSNRELIAVADEFIPLEPSPESMPTTVRRGRHPVPRPVAVPSAEPRPSEARPSETRPETRPVAVARPEPRPSETRPAETRPEPRAETRPEPRPETRPEPRPAEVRPEPRPAASTARELRPSEDQVLAEIRRCEALGELPTPRQVIRALVPSAQDRHGRARSAVANLVEQLIRDGRLIRRQAVVSGALSEVLSTPEGLAQAAPLEGVPAPLGEADYAAEEAEWRAEPEPFAPEPAEAYAGARSWIEPLDRMVPLPFAPFPAEEVGPPAIEAPPIQELEARPVEAPPEEAPPAKPAPKRRTRRPPRRTAVVAEAPAEPAMVE